MRSSRGNNLSRSQNNLGQSQNNLPKPASPFTREQRAILAKLTFLVVEDNEFLRKEAIRLFTKFGLKPINIKFADNGAVALQLIQDSVAGFDLVYMDDQMPVMQGEETARGVREIEKQKKYKRSFIFTCSSTYEGCFPDANCSIPKPLREKDGISLLLQNFFPKYNLLSPITSLNSCRSLLFAACITVGIVGSACIVYDNITNPKR